MRKVFALLGILALSAATPTPTVTAGETPICRSVEEAARANMLPVAMLTRLLWVESRFQAGAVSTAGAQGVAQFMPATATERGLFNPFIPEQAIRHAAKFLADLDLQFGNLGLAVASYNAGPGRVAKWLTGDEALPRQTRSFVLIVTGHTADEWAAVRRYRPIDVLAGSQSCAAVINTGFSIDRGRVFRGGLESSGRLLSEMQRSGRPLPGMERSGALLLGMERRGRLTRDAKRSGSAITASFGTGLPRNPTP
jgi:transglycosylase-like protein with SLT domain